MYVIDLKEKCSKCFYPVMLQAAFLIVVTLHNHAHDDDKKSPPVTQTTPNKPAFLIIKCSLTE